VSLDILSVSLDILSMSLDILSVSLDILSVSLDIHSVSRDILSVSLDILSVLLDILSVSLDHQDYKKERQTTYGVLHWTCSSGLEEMRWIHCALDGCGYTVFCTGRAVVDLRR
jgi:hypothetical protein